MKDKADRIILALFFLYVFMLPFENILEVQWNVDTPYRPYRILAILIGFLILFSRKFQSIKFHTNDLKLLGIYAFGLIPSLIAWADNRLYSESFLSTSLQFFIILWIVLLIKNIPFELKHIYTCMNIFCAGVFINSLYVILIFFTEDLGRQSGWMDNPNYAAFVNCIAFSYLFYLFYHGQFDNNKYFKIFLLLASLVILLALFFTGSRSAMIVLGISLILIIGHNFNFRKLLKNAAIVLVPVFLLFQIVDFNRFMALVPAWNRLLILMDTEDSRTVLWKQGFEAFSETGFIGLGIEQFKNPDNYRKYVHKTENVSVAMQQGLVLHNDYLTVLFEYGIIPFLLFLSFYLFLFRKLWKRYLMNPSQFVFLICFIDLAVFSMFLTSFQTHSMWFVYIMLGFLAYIKPECKNNSYVSTIH